MNYKKIIFLDIDGVLNVYCPTRDSYGCHFHIEFINNLKRLIDETGAEIVISSTWRLSGFKILLEMWDARKLPGQVIGITDILHYTQDDMSGIRGDEVRRWLDENPTQSYVIIDDDTDFHTDQLPFFVQTSDNQNHQESIDAGGYGLTTECTDDAIKILNQKDD